MAVIVRVTKTFRTAVKPLLKRYPSLSKDLMKLESDLINEPRQGTALGHNVYKIRLKITGKAKGKSGGARVISLVETTLIGEISLTSGQVTINLITIYDKADTANINDKELRELIKAFHQDK